MTEKDLERAIAEMARFLGFMVFHARPAQSNKGWRTPVAYDGKGFPDLLLVGNERVIFLEIKTDVGRVSPDQSRWSEQIIQSGGEYFLLRPNDWTSGRVDSILGATQRRRA